MTLNTSIKQVQDALDVARQEIVAKMAEAQSARYTSVQAQEVALHDKVEASNGLQQALETRTVAAAIEERANEAKLKADNLAASSAASQEAAAEVASAMSTAAASVKAAVGALEALTVDTSGITTLIHSNDRGETVDRGGQAANKALKTALDRMNELKSASLASNVIAAQSQAGTTAQTFTYVQTQIGEVQAAAALQLTRANDLATKAVAERNRTAAFCAARIDPRDAALDNVETLGKALSNVDEATEGLIKVEVKPGTKAQLQVTYKPWDSDKPPAELQFIAVKLASVPGFTYNRDDFWTPPDVKPGQLAASYEQILTHDSQNEPIAFGQTYCVFVTWKRGAEPADGEDGRVRSLTVPSAPVFVRLNGMKAPEAPGYRPLAAEGFVLAIREPKDLPADYKVERRLFIVPKRLEARNEVDQLMLASRTNQSSYLACPEALPLGTNFDQAAGSLIKLNKLDAGRAGVSPLTDEEIRKRIDPFRESTLVYFSQYEESVPGKESGSGAYYVGSYADVFGDQIDLTTETYMAAVVYVLFPPPPKKHGKTEGQTPDNATPEDPTLETDPAARSAQMFLSDPTPIGGTSPWAPLPPTT